MLPLPGSDEQLAVPHQTRAHPAAHRALPALPDVPGAEPAAAEVAAHHEGRGQRRQVQQAGSSAQGNRAPTQNWQREYLLMLGDHVVAVGFAMCFSPYQLEIILSILYFGLRCAY